MHTERPRPASVHSVVTSRTEQATAAILVVFGAFQTALAAGAPWARASYGGAHRGRLPDRLRAVSGGAALAYAGLACLVLSGRGSLRLRSRTFTTLTVWMTVGVLANGASRSNVERMIWTPLSAAAALLAWRSGRHRL